MRNLETNDWLTLNNIIYSIYTTENQTEMRTRFLEQMKMMIDFDSADFYLATCRIPADTDAYDTDGGIIKKSLPLIGSPVYFNCDYTEAGSDCSPFYSMDIVKSGRSIVYRTTDIISDDERINSVFYRKIYKTNNWHNSLQMVLGRNGRFLGKVSFYRTIGKDNFIYDDIFIADLLKDHLAYRLEKDYEAAAANTGKLTVSQAAVKFDLTNRESDILRHLMKGLDNEEICSELCISVNTLKKHILNIYRKLGINNRVQLFKMIMEHE